MADQKISELTAAAPAAADYLPILDVSDTAMGPGGSTRKALVSDLPFSAAWHTHTASEISDGTAAGRTLLTAVDAAAQRTALGLGAAALATGFDFLSTLTAAEISVTEATTATVGRMHVCSGTSADYTLTLPTAASNAGKLLAVRMSDALTKMVTLDGNGTETIDGSLTRVMWAGESAVLLSDGANWFRLAGRSIPMQAMLESSAATSASHDTSTKITLGTSLFDTGSIGDTANSRVTVRRAGRYQLSAMVNFDSLAADTRVVGVFRAGATPSAYKIFTSGFARGASNTLYVSGAAAVNLAAADRVELWASWDVSGGSGSKSTNVSVPEVKPFLAVTEVPTW